jgi:hypothetical protein
LISELQLFTEFTSPVVQTPAFVRMSLRQTVMQHIHKAPANWARRYGRYLLPSAVPLGSTTTKVKV